MSRTPDEIQQALGAGPPRLIRTLPHGPFGLAQLAAEFAEHPVDSERAIERPVGFRPETWQALSEIAARASTAGRRISPSQVAAHLIEEGIERLRAS
jgi:hypothetical protein